MPVGEFWAFFNNDADAAAVTDARILGRMREVGSPRR
jgi:hypothetical protein